MWPSSLFFKQHFAITHIETFSQLLLMTPGLVLDLTQTSARWSLPILVSRVERQFCSGYVCTLWLVTFLLLWYNTMTKINLKTAFILAYHCSRQFHDGSRSRKLAHDTFICAQETELEQEITWSYRPLKACPAVKQSFSKARLPSRAVVLSLPDAATL